jgi:signal transduction histidine kinase
MRRSVLDMLGDIPETLGPMTAAASADQELAVAFDHRVQFYQQDESLYPIVREFFSAGQRAGEPLLAITTELHGHDLLAELTSSGFDVVQLQRSGQLMLLDAEKTLAGFMVDGMPDRALFQEQVGGAIARLRSTSRNGHIRGYGEMVDLLWRAENPRAMICLEELWNELGRSGSEGPMTLLCSYFISSFETSVQIEEFQQICATHAHVSMVGDPGNPLAEVHRLQERARALESEIEHRKRLEQALRSALAERTRAEEALRESQQDRRQLEDELRRQNEDLSRTVRFSEMFVGILGHDLRNPLSAIATAASLLGRRADSDKVAKPAIRILNSAGRMGRMIDQLLDFTRIRLGKGIPIEQSETNLAEVCRLAIDELESGGQAGKIQLEATGDPVGRWDADRLLQLASNLLSNALAHGTGCEPIVVRVDGSDRSGVVLEVQNAGSVPTEVIPVLFEPFRSGSNEKQARSNGLGLGLFISQQIAISHAGTIEVISSEADGTRLCVRLPRNPPRSELAFGSAGDYAQ